MYSVNSVVATKNDDWSTGYNIKIWFVMHAGIAWVHMQMAIGTPFLGLAPAINNAKCEER